eukprot:TRINITY_DN12359_c0_g1_i1.p3 TRINITY_DN12359_c0_g1~~TRINITY_DN12359_c0_g1_i1.p3  ORF type:complete len:100 (+),score=18.58 TRINITY_DN12359_c0_g1_i1:61-360(+)
MLRRPPRSTHCISSAASDVYKRQGYAERPKLAESRQRDFWGGSYNRFLVSGPANLTVEVARNGSFNANCAGLFLDEALAERPEPYFCLLYTSPSPRDQA